MEKLTSRFIRYAKVNTQSDENSNACPTTEGQKQLAIMLMEELKEIGLADVNIDENSYLTASLPSNTDGNIPVVGYIAHFDTSPEFNGNNVKPQIHKFLGEDIILNKEENIILSPKTFPLLRKYHGQEIITSDGTTLLGADDKAGIAEIVTAMEYLIEHPEIKHGNIRIAFTPDEEIGRGADKFDVEKFAADFAYTLDGSGIGEIEYENFNAAKAVFEVKGLNVHPGYAKNKMKNSMLIASEIIQLLPCAEIPGKTEDYEGFFHLLEIKGSVEQTIMNFIIRDHDRNSFENRKTLITQIKEFVNMKYGEGTVQLSLTDQYYNMKEKIEPVFHIVELAKEAIKKSGIEPIEVPIRGGTDGSKLSYMGLPCPNLFAGGHNFHSRYEFLPVESMKKAVEVIVRLSELIVKNSTL